jgi:hypothetical protein
MFLVKSGLIKKLNYLTPNEVITVELEKRGFHS